MAEDEVEGRRLPAEALEVNGRRAEVTMVDRIRNGGVAVVVFVFTAGDAGFVVAAAAAAAAAAVGERDDVFSAPETVFGEVAVAVVRKDAGGSSAFDDAFIDDADFRSESDSLSTLSIFSLLGAAAAEPLLASSIDFEAVLR